jgi:hypothetical protein
MHCRAILVLIFATVAGALLLKFPGPVFRNDAKIAHEFAPVFTKDLPMDADDAETLDLRRRAGAALAELQAKKPHE